MGICPDKTEIKPELLTNVDMLLMVEKGIRGGNMSCNTEVYKSK